MSEEKTSSSQSLKDRGWTWVAALAMVAVSVLAWFYFIPVAVAALATVCVIGTAGGAARRVRAKSRALRAPRPRWQVP